MLVQTRAEFDEALEALSTAHTVVLDTETTWTNNWMARDILGISAFVPNVGGWYFPFKHQHDQTLFNTRNLPLEYLTEIDVAFKRETVTTIFHNAKFDLQVLRRAGVNIQGKFWCTMLMSYMVDENTSHALDNLSKAIFGTQKVNKIKAVADACGGWEKVPPEAMAKYAIQDVELTYNLFLHFYPRLEEQDMLHLWRNEQIFCRLLADMESVGVGINREMLKQLSITAGQEMDIIKANLGFDPMKPAELAKYLYDDCKLPVRGRGKPTKQFPEGRPTMDEAVLLSYSNRPEVHAVLRYRGLLKAQSTWLIGFLQSCDSDGRLHPRFNQHGTKTTRLSCAEPNMQQIPRDEKSSPVPIKKALSPRPGFQLWEFDYSQIELRLAAAISQEQAMLITLREGGDIHQLTANLCDISRYAGKTLNFAMLYGAGSGKISELLGVSLEEGRGILATFHGAYPRLKMTADRCQLAAEEKMWIRLWTGRRRHFVETYECHKAFNSFVQGGAAEIVKQTGNNIYKAYDDFPSRIVAMVHDAYWIEIPEGQIESEIMRLRLHMEEWCGKTFGVPFPVDCRRLA